MNSALEELRKRIEGKTTVKVEEPNAAEAICKFTLSDGTAFRLHATDLGFWIEDTVVNNSKYTNFTSMFTDVYHHQSNIEPTVVIDSNDLKITTDDGRVFIADISLLSKWERKVCKHKKSKELIAVACTFGNLWKMIFSKREAECPEELYFESDEK